MDSVRYILLKLHESTRNIWKAIQRTQKARKFFKKLLGKGIP